MSRLLLPTVITLWVLNITYVLLDILHAAPVPHSTQPLMVLGALSATILWVATYREDRFALGYSQGVLDATHAQLDRERSAQTARDRENA